MPEMWGYIYTSNKDKWYRNIAEGEFGKHQKYEKIYLQGLLGFMLLRIMIKGQELFNALIEYLYSNVNNENKHFISK